MVGVVVITHGEMAAGLIGAVEMIMGKQTQLIGVALREEDDVDELVDRIAAASEKVADGQGVLLLVDLPGASPFNASARLAMTRTDMRLVSGVNLAMLAEVLVLRSSATLDEVVEIAVRSGKSAIKTLQDILPGN